MWHCNRAGSLGFVYRKEKGRLGCQTFTVSNGRESGQQRFFFLYVRAMGKRVALRAASFPSVRRYQHRQIVFPFHTSPPFFLSISNTASPPSLTTALKQRVARAMSTDALAKPTD